MPLRLIFFASNNASTMRAIQQAIGDGLNAEIALLLSNNPKASALRFARDHAIPAEVIDPNRAPIDQIAHAKPDLIILSGYLKKIPPELIDADIAPIINMHPALLPKFGGKGMFGIHVHRAVIKAGARVSGATLHFVNRHYDQGDIIAQSQIALSDGDSPESLAQKVMAEEAKLLTDILAQIADSPLAPQRALEKIAAAR